MNLIDAHVTEVISAREFKAEEEWNLSEGHSLYGKTFITFKVKYWDDGGDSITDLIYELGNVPDVKPGFIFQH